LPAHPRVLLNYQTTTFSPFSRNSSTRIPLPPTLMQYLPMASTLPRSLIYQLLPHRLRLATTVAPALPALLIVHLPLVASQQTAPSSRMLMSLSARRVLMIWRRTVQAKSPVCIVQYKSSHALIGALLSAKKSPARRKSGTSQVSAIPYTVNVLCGPLTKTLMQDESRLMKRKEQNRAAQRAFRERKEKHVKDVSSTSDFSI
jgi:hypothetical protein